MSEASYQDLEREIEQMVNLGERDPLDIARKIIDRHEPGWVGAELLARAEDIIAEFARRQLGSVRRSAELMLRPGDEFAEGAMRLAKIWVPGSGWKVAADLTSADLRARADWYQKFANAALRRRNWCLEVAALMEIEGAETLGKLKAPLPALSEGEVLPELPDAA